MSRDETPHRAREDTGVQRGRADPQTQGKCIIKVRMIWVMPGPEPFTPSVSASPFSDIFFICLFSPISPLIKYDFRPLCGNMGARPSTWSKHPQPASSEPGDTWLMPRCRRLGGGGSWQMSSGDPQRRAVSEERCHLHSQDGEASFVF